ncbi:hypothetical protein PENTCL1PPCAC_8987, partial [Pristionchus entomophagus]
FLQLRLFSLHFIMVSMCSMLLIHGLMICSAIAIDECINHQQVAQATQLQVNQTYSCKYSAMLSEDGLSADPLCDFRCPAHYQLISTALLGSSITLQSVSLESSAWKGTISSSSVVDLPSSMQLQCQAGRCAPYKDSTGSTFDNRCNVADLGAVCNENTAQPQCSCSEEFTGPTCSIRNSTIKLIEEKFGPEIAKKLLEIVNLSKGSPSALIDLLPMINALRTQEEKKSWGWKAGELVESISYELKGMDTKATLTESFFDSLGGCLSACYQDKIMVECGCMDPRYRGSSTAQPCSMAAYECIARVSVEHGDPSMWPTCTCPQACYQEVYTLSATQADLPFIVPDCHNETYGCPELNYQRAQITIFMSRKETSVYAEVYKTSRTTVVSQLGAQLGLVGGISIFFAIELAQLTWIMMRGLYEIAQA